MTFNPKQVLNQAVSSLPKGVTKVDAPVLGSIPFFFKDPRPELVIFERELAAALNKSIRDAGPAYISGLSRALDAAMTTPLPWQGFERRVTKRKNQTIATYPRDIVDLGELKASKRLEKTPSGVNINYDDPAAASVHFGFRHTKSGQFIPGRPWINLAVNERLNDRRGDLNKLIGQEISRLATEQMQARRRRRR